MVLSVTIHRCVSVSAHFFGGDTIHQCGSVYRDTVELTFKLLTTRSQYNASYTPVMHAAMRFNDNDKCLLMSDGGDHKSMAVKVVQPPPLFKAKVRISKKQIRVFCYLDF